MAPLLNELSILEVELLEIVENKPAPEQESGLDSLTTLSDIDVEAILMGKLPVNDPTSCGGGGPSGGGPVGPCCCCCPCCCCL